MVAERWRRAGRRRESHRRLRGDARGASIRRRRKPSRVADPRRRAEQHDLSMAPRRPEGDRGGVQERRTTSPTRFRQQPPGAERDRAARRVADYDFGSRPPHALEHIQKPHVARLVMAAFVGMAPEHKLRVIAPDVGGGFGSKIFIYPEEVVCLWASFRKVELPGEMELQIAPRPSSPTRTAATTSPTPRWRSTPREKSPPCARKPSPISRPLSTFSSSVPTYLYATLLSGQYGIPNHLLRGRCGLHQHRAGRCLSRRRAAGADTRYHHCRHRRRRARRTARTSRA